MPVRFQPVVMIVTNSGDVVGYELSNLLTHHWIEGNNIPNGISVGGMNGRIIRGKKSMDVATKEIIDGTQLVSNVHEEFLHLGRLVKQNVDRH